MSTDTKQDYSLTTFDYVVVDKQNLLGKLRENRNEHNSLYEAACSGYWVQAQTVLTERKAQFSQAVEKLQDEFGRSLDERTKAVPEKDLKNVGGFSAYFGFQGNWPLAYPTNHLEDYDRVISMLEFSIANKVQLKSDDFNCYVRNDWNWNKDFETVNLGYIRNVTGGMLLSDPRMMFAVSGCHGLVKSY